MIILLVSTRKGISCLQGRSQHKHNQRLQRAHHAFCQVLFDARAMWLREGEKVVRGLTEMLQAAPHGPQASSQCAEDYDIRGSS